MIEKRQRRRRGGGAYTVWRVRWYENGRERSRTFDRAADARAFEGKVRTLKRSEGIAELDAGSETLQEFVAEWWDSYATPNLERNTLTTYSIVWTRHALPRLGSLKLRQLSPPVLARFPTDLEAAGVGPEAIRKTLAMLSSVLQRAVEWERLSSNSVRVIKKPPARRKRAVRPLSPATVEQVRTALLDEKRQLDATLVSVLAYAGLRPQEALALQWRHVRDRTLLIEQAVSDGELKGQKTGKPPRTVHLLGPLKHDLSEWRLRGGMPSEDSFLFPSSNDAPWRDHAWRNWRKRVYAPTAEACGVATPRPYDLRHSFASLLIHEGPWSIVEIAHQLGHDPNTCLSTYAHVMAELQDGEPISAEQRIRDARAGRSGCGPNTAQEIDPAQLSLSESPSWRQALFRTRTGDPFLTMEVLYQLS